MEWGLKPDGSGPGPDSVTCVTVRPLGLSFLTSKMGMMLIAQGTSDNNIHIVIQLRVVIY